MQVIGKYIPSIPVKRNVIIQTKPVSSDTRLDYLSGGNHSLILQGQYAPRGGDSDRDVLILQKIITLIGEMSNDSLA